MNASGAVLVLGGVLAGVATLSSMPAFAQTAPDADPRAQQLMQQACTVCHGLAPIMSTRRTAAEWDATLGDMIGRGAALLPGEREVLLEFLAKTFGPPAPKTNVNDATALQLVTVFALSEREAQDIVRYRQKHGTFRGWEDLRKVPAVDLRKLEAKKELVSFF